MPSRVPSSCFAQIPADNQVKHALTHERHQLQRQPPQPPMPMADADARNSTSKGQTKAHHRNWKPTSRKDSIVTESFSRPDETGQEL